MANEEDVIVFDDDSVPSDFFDDFSNQEFMAGLDVVDACWDDDEDGENNSKEEGLQLIDKKKNEGKSRHRKRNKIKTKRSRSRSGGARKKGKSEIEDKLKRDPEKAKRDIQKDKDKWTKTNEAKLISERLKVVETGLVPPGTEMDFDLKEMKSKVNLPDLREKLRKRSRSSSFDLSTRLTHRRRSRDYRRSPIQRRSRTHSRPKSQARRSFSPLRRRPGSLHRSTSPFRRLNSPRPDLDRRTRNRGLSPVRTRRFSRSRSPAMLGREARRYSRPRSPVYTQHDIRRRSRPLSRSRPRSPDLSDREMWMRDRHRRKRSVSPKLGDRRKHIPKDFLEELADKLKYDEKKKKILQEISHKLNEPVLPNVKNQGFAPASALPMGPRLPPGPVQGSEFLRPFHPAPPIHDASQYDQSFFIGAPLAQFPPNNFEPNSGPQMVPQPINYPHIDNRNLSVIQTANNKSQNFVSPEQQRELDKKAATKLLEDKSITLSDYLCMTVKYDSSKPVNIHKKVKVLAQCQDALKALGNTAKLNGRFFLTKNNKNTDKSAVIKCLSPLRKIPVTRFAFTTPWKGSDDKMGVQSSLQKLLISLGMSITDLDNEPNRSPSPVSTDSDLVYVPSEPAPMHPLPPPPPHIQRSPQLLRSPQMKPSPQIQPKPLPIVNIRFQTKLTQTDVDKCETCETRKAIKYKQQGIQCCAFVSNSSTQITEEDLQRFGLKPSIVGVTKKSLAHLTPAQLLRDELPQRREAFIGSQQIAPQAPNLHTQTVQLQSATNLPSIIDKLRSTMKNMEQSPSTRYVEPTYDMPKRFDGVDQDRIMRITGYNHMPEFREDSRFLPRMVSEERMMQLQQPYFQVHEENLRMQEERMRMQSHFQPQERQDNHFSRGFSPRKYF